MWLERAKHVFKAMDGFGRFLSALRALRWAPEKHSIDFACVLSPTFLPKYLALFYGWCGHFHRVSRPRLLMLDVILGQVPPTETTRMGLTFTTVTPSPPVRRPKIKVVPRRQDWNELLGTSRTEDRDLKSHIMQGRILHR